MPRTPAYVKERVTNLLQCGKQQHEIVAKIKAEGHYITRQTVACLKKWLQETGSTAYKILTGQPSILTDVHSHFIDTNMKNNDEFSSVGRLI